LRKRREDVDEGKEEKDRGAIKRAPKFKEGAGTKRGRF